MRGYLKALVGFLILFSTPVFSGEITDKEWIPLINTLIVTYYHDGAYSEVNCMAFNKQGKPIGDGVAQPCIDVTTKIAHTRVAIIYLIIFSPHKPIKLSVYV